MPIHRKLTGEQIHTPFTWIFADETARISETVTDSNLVGKIAWQQDDDSIWILIGSSPAVWASKFNSKADKVSGHTTGNLAALDADGNLFDSGKSPDDIGTGGGGGITEDQAIMYAIALG